MSLSSWRGHTTYSNLEFSAEAFRKSYFNKFCSFLRRWDIPFSLT